MWLFLYSCWYKRDYSNLNIFIFLARRLPLLGGGWSFLQACVDKNGNHWGEHSNMEELFCLGIAIGKVESLLPRDMWKVLPGGVPYYVIH